jgi:hypothetical protein
VLDRRIGEHLRLRDSRKSGRARLGLHHDELIRQQRRTRAGCDQLGLLDHVHLRFVGREEHVALARGDDLPRQRVRRAEVERHFFPACSFSFSAFIQVVQRFALGCGGRTRKQLACLPERGRSIRPSAAAAGAFADVARLAARDEEREQHAARRRTAFIVFPRSRSVALTMANACAPDGEPQAIDRIGCDDRAHAQARRDLDHELGHHVAAPQLHDAAGVAIGRAECAEVELRFAVGVVEQRRQRARGSLRAAWMSMRAPRSAAADKALKRRCFAARWDARRAAPTC